MNRHIALITGASTRIGIGIAEKLTEEGTNDYNYKRIYPLFS